MTELQIYHIVLFSSLAVAGIIFVILLFMAAPYGRYVTKGWGVLINHKLGWIIQEAPASLLMLFYFLIDSRQVNATGIILLIVWQTHYFHRAFIYPFMLRSSNKVPVTTVLLAVLFNLVNTYVQGRWLFKLAPESMYTPDWLGDPRFIAGIIIFYTGYAINKRSDTILRNLRSEGEGGYKIPHGGLFKYVSCPNYFGEMITWLGWALATWSLAGVFFLVLTVANLGPRARAHHAWYKRTFPDYPGKRKAIIPFVF
ncbi:MAG: 3-oxo-5-alpha-steroid 4-dehydrogenase [Spirochaetes bacterium RBG_16_49_21]|nr:MAG: 3-oxo-5-alpha-steroid 4-dehydrogenase [Spirochaetes bacterium RBG_16_49_21]